MLRIAEAADPTWRGSGTGSSRRPRMRAWRSTSASPSRNAGRRRARVGRRRAAAWDGPAGRLAARGRASAAIACDGARQQQGGPVDRERAPAPRAPRWFRRRRPRAAPSLGLPGRFLAGRRCLGERHRDDRRSLLGPLPPSTSDAGIRPVHRRTPSLHVIGDATGVGGLASALRSAASRLAGLSLIHEHRRRRPSLVRSPAGGLRSLHRLGTAADERAPRAPSCRRCRPGGSRRGVVHEPCDCMKA